MMSEPVAYISSLGLSVLPDGTNVLVYPEPHHSWNIPLYTHPAPADPAMPSEEWLKEAEELLMEYRDGCFAFQEDHNDWEPMKATKLLLLSHLRRRVQP